MKHITSYKNKKSPKIRHFLPINITVASRAKNKIPETLVNRDYEKKSVNKILL